MADTPAETHTSRLAEDLLDRAQRDEQVAHRIGPRDDVEAVRAEVRRLARERGIKVRTGMVDDVLVVIRADARLWTEPTSVMRSTLTPE